MDDKNKNMNTSYCNLSLGLTTKARACMNHLDICSTSYDKKKGRESNWQFDSRPLKVRNQPDPSACKWSVTYPWKALNKSYKFVLDLIPIGGLSKEV
jgi:hypothetical protein